MDQNSANQSGEQQKSSANKQKSVLERFYELEGQVVQMVQLYKDAETAFSEVAKIVKGLSNQVAAINAQLQAIYDICENDAKISRNLVVETINKRQLLECELMLKNNEDAGYIKPIEAVEVESDIVVYEAPDIILAFKAAGNFKDEGIALEELVGKKSGDEVKNIKIKKVYRIVAEEQTKEASKE